MRVQGLVTAVIVSAALLLGVAAGADAATVSGTVRARDGARLPFSTVTLRNLDSGAELRGAAGDLGTFVFAEVPPGQYEVRVEAPGFRAAVLTLVLNGTTGDDVVLDPLLEVEAVSEAVTVMGTARRDTLEAAAIRELGATDVGEALAGQEGVWQLRKGSTANDVVLRGLQSRDLNVLIDGQRTYGACPNHMDPPAFHVDFAEVERIEVSKGPFDVRYQGSLGGLVNVVTRRPEEGWHATTTLGGGSDAYVNPSAVLSYGGTRWFALGGASWRRAEPYSDGDGTPFTERVNYLPSQVSSDAFRVASGWGRAVGRLGAKEQVAASYTLQDADHVMYPYLLMDGLWDRTHRASVRFDRSASGRLDAVQAQVYHTRVDHWMTDEYRVSSVGMPRAYSMATDAETRTTGGRLDVNAGRVSGGLEVVDRGWNSETLLAGRKYVPQASIPDVEIVTAGAFVTWSAPLGPRWSLDTGGRVDYVTSRADADEANLRLYQAYHATQSTSRTDVLPAGKVRLAWTAGAFKGDVGLGHTARVAEANERYFALQRAGSDWVGNPELDPVRNTGLETSLSWSRSGTTLEAHAFLNRIDGYIAVVDQPRVTAIAGVANARARSYANVLARLVGMEATASVPLGGRLFLSGDLSYVRGTQREDASGRDVSTPLAEMPALRARARLRYDDGRVFAVVEEVATADQSRVDTSLGETPTPGAAITNVSGGTRMGQQWVATIGIANLFDRFYSEALSYQRDPFRSGARLYEPGRRWFGKITWRF